MIFGIVGNSLQEKYKDKINDVYAEEDYSISSIKFSEINIYYFSERSKTNIKKFIQKDNGMIINGDIYKCKGAKNTPQGIWDVYQKQGIPFLETLNGSFILMLYDAKNKQTVLASDKMNTRSLFYSFEENGLVFSSDLKFLSRFLKRAVSIEPLVLMKYVTFCYNPGSQTFFQGIKRLLPAHFLIWKRGSGSVKKYWSLSFSNQTEESKKEIGENIREKLTEAVRIRINKKEKIGAFLSGGLDSSSIVSLLSSNSKQDISTYSFRCKGKSYDESVYARIVAENFNTQFNLLEYSPEDVLKAEKMVESMDEPFCDVGINIATYLLSEYAAGKVSGLFTGDGGDELFAGHPVYIADKVNRMFGWIPDFILNPIFTVGRSLEDSEKKKDLRVKFKRFSESYRYPASLGTHRWRVYYNPSDLKQLLVRGWWNGENPEDIFNDVIQFNNQTDGKDMLSRSLASDYQTVVQFYNRRLSLARSFGLHPKMPMLDPDLASYCATIPSSLKIKGFSDVKYIEKIAVEPLLPREIVYRKDKLGHSIPLKNWLIENSTVKEFVYDLISETTLRSRNYFNPDYVNTMKENHLRREHNNSHRLWALAILELWLRSLEH
ncbi:MAG: asparagine synthase-related protein [bacterium]